MIEITANSNPFEIFEEWFDAAKNSGLKEPTAMNLATATKEGKPSSRIVLLKAFDERGFVFYTNSRSRKGKELAENQNVALCFYWMELGRQVRIEGKVTQVKGKEADEYFASRHVESRLGAWASQQSEILEKREDFLNKVEEMRKKFGNNPARPLHWFGFRVNPERIEFWQEGKFRMHDRDVFERDVNSESSDWKHFRLYP